MTKRGFTWYRNLSVLFGSLAIGIGISMPFRSAPETLWQMILMIVNTTLLIILGVMQFGLARTLHRRAQKL